MNHRPRKRFGQNFLRDQGVALAMLSAIGARLGQHIVEIGPGQGALTGLLLKSGARLDVVELDRDLVAFLGKEYSASENLSIHSGDALRFDFSALCDPGEKLRIIGNLPYNISTPLLFHLLDQASCIQDMHFMLQKEVVERICAEPGSKRYGKLSVMMQYRCAAEKLFDVYPESFDPPPKVTSAVVRLTPHAVPPVSVIQSELLEKVVTQAFSQRRKTLRNSLKTLLSEDDMTQLGIDPGARPETLPLQVFASLSNRLSDKMHAARP
ncbi:MAG: 16S rRNA (adenine(1518)-N(6)/adenine(1519)-N(6))-dimethyltransferase RsmA [Pseudomonadota bacterium]